MEIPRVVIRSAPAYEPEPGAEPHLNAAVLTAPPPAPARAAVARGVATARDARRQAVLAVTLVLEVIDRRRGSAQLESVASGTVRDQVAALVRVQGVRASGTGSTLRRVHVQMCGPAGAEVFGSMTCGSRVRAFAGRVEYRPCRVRPRGANRPGTPRIVEYRWQLVSFTVV